MFGDVYSNRGFVDNTAGASPGGSPVVASPVSSRLLLVPDEGAKQEADAHETRCTRTGVSITTTTRLQPSTSFDSLKRSSLSQALLGVEDEHEFITRIAEEVQISNVAQRTCPPQVDGSPTASTSDPSIPIVPSTSAVPPATFPRPSSVHNLFREAPLIGNNSSASHSRRAQFAFDPWTKLPVRVISLESTDVDGDTQQAVNRYCKYLRFKWCWRVQSPSWWVAFCYLVGSAGFALGGLASCFREIISNKTNYFHLEVLPYMVGGMSFLVATVLLLYTSWTARYGEPGRAHRRAVAMRHAFLGNSSGTSRGRRTFNFYLRGESGSDATGASADAVPSNGPSAIPSGFWQLRAAVGEAGLIGDSITQPLMDDERSELLNISDAMEEARRLWLANDSWTRRRRALELVSSGLILLGVLLYKVMVFTMFARCVFDSEEGSIFDRDHGSNRSTSGSNSLHKIKWNGERDNLFLCTVPSIIGSLFFVAGSYVLWCAVNRTWSPPWLPKNTPTWIAWLSVVGSFLYLLGSIPPILPHRFIGWVSGHGIGGESSIDTSHSNYQSLTPEWPFLFVGFFLGSLVFALQSLLMIHEIAESVEE